LSELTHYRTEDGRSEVRLPAEAGSVWLTQGEIAELFAASKQNVSLHTKNTLQEGELAEGATVKESLRVQTEGGRRVRSPHGTQFRQWATAHLSKYLVKGFVIDEPLAHIREILASEKRFYQKVHVLFALNSDYRKDDKDAQPFGLCGALKPTTGKVFS